MMAVGFDVDKASLGVAIEESAGVTLVASSAAGIGKLARQLAGLDQARIAVEATGARLGFGQKQTQLGPAMSTMKLWFFTAAIVQPPH